MLPYGEFKKERPGVMPSTYRDYMAYQYAKPEAGSLVTIDPKRGSFTALGGMVRGSAKGLNDPELRIRGFKTTASEIGGLYAGTQAMKATMGFLGKKGTGAGDIDTSSFNPNINVKPEYTQTTAGGTQITDPKIKDIRQQELSRFVKDVKDDFTSMDRTLQQGTKIAGDRLQRIETKSGQSELSREGKPYNEYRVGVKSEQDPAKVAILKLSLIHISEPTRPY